MKRIFVCGLILLIFLTTLAGCGCPPEGSEGAVSLSETVRANEGATLSGGGDRVTLEIPAGALAKDVRISINEVAEEDLPEQVRELAPEGEVFQLGPDGLELGEPVTFTMNLSVDDIQDYDPEVIPIYTLITVSKDGEVDYAGNMETVVSGDGSIKVTGTISHFSWIIRQKAFLEVRLWEIDEDIEVDRSFRVEGQLRNRATTDTEWTITADAELQTAGAIAFAEYEDDPFSDDYGEVTGMHNQETKAGMSLVPHDIKNFSWTCRGMEPGTGIFTMIVRAEEKNPNYKETLKYQVVLEDTVKVVPREYSVKENGGDRLAGMVSFYWKFAGRNNSRRAPAEGLYCWLEPVNLPSDFLESYDSGKMASSPTGSVDQQGRDLIVPLDGDGNVRFTLVTQVPGRYAFRVKKLVTENYTDDESYIGDGDIVEVIVPEASDMSGLWRECEPIGVPMRQFDEECYVTMWHLFEDESDIVTWDEIGFAYPRLTAPDGKEFSGLFLIMEKRSMVEGHPYLPYQFTDTYEIYRWAERLQGCGQFGANAGKCGYGEDGILYYTVCLRPWEIVTISIIDAADEFFTYEGNGDAVRITYPSDKDDVVIEYLE